LTTGNDAPAARPSGSAWTPDGVASRAAKPPLWLLVLVTISASISMHLFVPGLPAAAADLRVGAGQVQMAISLYFVGLAAGQLVYGPLSDAYGRRRLLLPGLALFVLGGVAAALAPDLTTLLVARVVQALGACAGMALGRAIVRDTTEGDETVRQMALLSLMILLWPGFAPMLGGALAANFGWRSIFVVLTALGAIAFCIAWRRLPETGRPTGCFTAHTLVADYRQLLGSARFVGFVVGGSAVMTGTYAFLATAPFILSGPLRQPIEAVGLYTGLVMIGTAAGSALAGSLVRRVGSNRMLLAGMTASTVAAATLLFLVLSQRLDVPLLVGVMLLFTCGAGVLNPVLLSKALTVEPRLAGSAAGLYGFTQMALGSVITSLAALGSDAALTCGVLLLGSALLACALIVVALRSEGRQDLRATAS